MEDLDFNQVRRLVNYRYVTGLSDMSEILELTKIDILNSSDKCVQRLFNAGYLPMENITKEELKNSQETYTILEVEQKSIFDSQLFLAKTRYLTGKTKNLKELLAVVKLIITEDLTHSARRLESEGLVIIVDPKYQKVESTNKTNYGHAFDDILG